MNVLQKARAHLVTLEQYIQLDEWRLDGGSRTVELAALGASHPARLTWAVPSENSPLRTPRRSIDAVRSAWTSITSKLEQSIASVQQLGTVRRAAQIVYGPLSSRDSPAERPSGSTLLSPKAHETAAVMTSASRFTQTLVTPRERLSVIGQLISMCCFRCFSYRRRLEVCSSCSLTPSLLSLPCVCPVCCKLYCVDCYGGTFISRVFGNRGCRRCGVVVERYEQFLGHTARLLEAGVYCVVHLPAFPPGCNFSGRDQELHAVALNPELRSNIELDGEDDTSSTSCFAMITRSSPPIGRLGMNMACLLTQLIKQVEAEDHNSCRAIAWFYLNADTAELEFRSLQRSHNKPCVRGSVHIENLLAIETVPERAEIILRLSNRDHDASTRGPLSWNVRMTDVNVMRQWATMLKLAWELLSPERLAGSE